MKKTCVIDNWTLFLISELFKNRLFFSHTITKKYKYNIGAEEPSDIPKYFGALSNFINAILFYDEIYFVENGNENSWNSNPYFTNQCKGLITPKKPITPLTLNYKNLSSIEEVKYYIFMSELLNSDLFVAPYRSDIILQSNELSINNITNDMINEYDKRITDLLKEQKDNKLKIGIESNQILPSLTQLVLNETKSVDDIFTTTLQIKNSDYIKEYKNKINEVIEGENITKDYIKLKKDMELAFNTTINKLGLHQNDKKKLFDVAFNLWIFKISNINVSSSKTKFNNKKHTILLKNIIKYRLEMFNSIESLSRILK